jgi:antitoxin component HigA of HigAB toxin-antitoxin module
VVQFLCGVIKSLHVFLTSVQRCAAVDLADGAFILVKFNGAESKHRRPPIYDRVTSETRPVEAIKFRMEQSGLTIKDLEPLIGRSNRVYEVLNHKRPLTLAMIRRLHRSLGIPAEVLIAETVSG